MSQPNKEMYPVGMYTMRYTTTLRDNPAICIVRRIVTSFIFILNKSATVQEEHQMRLFFSLSHATINNPREAYFAKHQMPQIMSAT